MFLDRITPKTRSEKRHLIKTLTWRFVGSLDTFVLATFFSTSIEAGTKIAITEVITKTALYYLHEKGWHYSISIK